MQMGDFVSDRAELDYYAVNRQAEVGWQRHLTVENLLLLIIMLLAIVSRFWDLGARALHHDESLHALYSYNLYIGRGYIHDPLLHGTFIYHFNAFIYFLFGASDVTARIAPAILSVLTVLLPAFLRRQLGSVAALIASLLLLISPAFLYFGRFLREDAHIAFFTLAMVVCIFRYLDGGKNKYLYFFAALFALSFNTKETTYLTAAVWGLFFLVVAGKELLGVLKRGSSYSRCGDVLVVIGTLALTQMGGAAILLKALRGGEITAYPSPEDYVYLGPALALVLVVAAFIGLRWRGRLWLGVAGTFFAVFVVFFTTMFSNPAGILTGSLGGLVYWLAQHDVKRGAQPWYYYLLLMPLYEYLVVGFGLPALLYRLVRRSLFSSFLIFWFVGSFVLFSWAGEKMPWLLVHLTLPLLLLAAGGISGLLRAANWRYLTKERLILGSGLVMAILLLLSIGGLGNPSFSGMMDLASQKKLMQWLTLAALMVVVFFFSLRAADQLGVRQSLVTLATTILLVLLPLTVRTGIQAAFTNGDVAVEMIVYTQTTPEVSHVVDELEQIGDQLGVGKDLKVAYDTEVTWPMEWYLREYRKRAFFGTGTPATDAPVVLVGVDGSRENQVRGILGSNYVSQRYRLRWWYPEDYQSADSWLRAITPEAKRAQLQPSTNVSFLDIMRATLQPEARERLWRYFLFRETFNPLGSTDFVMFVRKDLMSGAWMPAATVAEEAKVRNAFDGLERQVTAQQAIGAAGDAQPLIDPKSVAVAADGSIYVADGRANRIVRYAQDGAFLTAWGREGTANGEFKEPWGVAVGPTGEVFVTDTWNHRVQVFDAEGRFLRSWGGYADATGKPAETAGKFYGPRGIACDAAGQIYVVDTGNERIQVFDSNGGFVRQAGVAGGGEGYFLEPVGIALGTDKRVYVADAWNQRVQVLDAELKYSAEWTVPGWGTGAISGKPYVAVSKDGEVLVSDPDNHRVLVYRSNGVPVSTWGKHGQSLNEMDMPLGLATGPDGKIYVIDSRNLRVLVYSLTK